MMLVLLSFMKLLLTTFSLCPGEGSEPGVGWQAVQELAREHEVHALIDRNWEPKVRERLNLNDDAPCSPNKNIHLHFVGIPLLSKVVSRMHSTAAWLIYYYLWQFAACLAAARLHRCHHFDGAQHVTFVKYNVPNLTCFVQPFIFGPVGGAESAPLCFITEFDWKTRLAERARMLLQGIASFDPLLRWCVRRSECALGVTRETTAALKSLGARSVETWPAVSLSETEIAQIHAACTTRVTPQPGPCTLLYVGRLIAWKGVHLGLRALAQSQAKDTRLRVIGDGPLRARLEAEARALGIAERVEFLGALPRGEVLKAYAQADAFLYPSLHDSGGNAVLEAMCASLPILCLRFGGPDALVDDTCGWKIAALTPAQAIDGLAKAIDAVSSDTAERTRRGQHACDRCLDPMFGYRADGAGEELRGLWRDVFARAKAG